PEHTTIGSRQVTISQLSTLLNYRSSSWAEDKAFPAKLCLRLTTGAVGKITCDLTGCGTILRRDVYEYTCFHPASGSAGVFVHPDSGHRAGRFDAGTATSRQYFRRRHRPDGRGRGWRDRHGDIARNGRDPHRDRQRSGILSHPDVA